MDTNAPKKHTYKITSYRREDCPIRMHLHDEKANKWTIWYGMGIPTYYNGTEWVVTVHHDFVDFPFEQAMALFETIDPPKGRKP